MSHTTYTQASLKKNISTFSLTMTGVTSIIGSGWLLSTQQLSKVAGPAALLSWCIGMLIALLVALFYIEVGGAIASAGGIGYYSRLTHGRFSGFLTSWINWLSIVTVPAIEAQAIVQYLSQISPFFMRWYDLSKHSMTTEGIFVAILLVLFFMYLNYWSVKLFIRINNLLTIIKVAVPILTICCLFYMGMHQENFGSNWHQFAPYGFSSVLLGVVSCGVVMSFNGFQIPMTFSEEVVNPKRQVLIAVVSSILLTFVLYILLQVVFIGALNANMLRGGWHAINLRSPYIDLLLLANLQVVVWVVYVSSSLSPAACGATFVASSSRMLYALSSEGLLPKFISLIDPKYKSPRNAVVICTVISVLYLFMFRSWSSLVPVVSVLHILSYLPAPIIVIANRLKITYNSGCNDGNSSDIVNNNKAAKIVSGFKVPCATLLGIGLFIILSILLFLSAWPLIAGLIALIIPGLGFYYYYELRHLSIKEAMQVFKGASWLIIYMIGICLFCYLGNNPAGNILSKGVAMGGLAIFALIIFIYGAYYCVQRD